MSKLDVLSPTEAGELLRLHGLRPIKKLGQNFLCDRNIRDKIVRAANLTSDDPVLEIGGGLGALTEGLAAAASSVTTVEIDTGFRNLLTTRFLDTPHVQFVFGDFLRLHLKELFDQAFGDKPRHRCRQYPLLYHDPNFRTSHREQNPHCGALFCWFSVKSRNA